MPFDRRRVFDSDEILELERLPRTLTVIGGGVIGVEYATIFSALEVPVTLIEPRDRHPRLRRARDRRRFRAPDARPRHDRSGSAAAVREIASSRRGVEVALGRRQRACARRSALRRRAHRATSAALGLEAIGIEVDARGRLKVDPRTFQTSVPNFYAAGDVIGFPSLASTSMEQGESRPVTPSACRCRRRRELSLRHIRGAGDLDGRPSEEQVRGERRRLRDAASRGSARPRAAISWG